MSLTFSQCFVIWARILRLRSLFSAYVQAPNFCASCVSVECLVTWSTMYGRAEDKIPCQTVKYPRCKHRILCFRKRRFFAYGKQSHEIGPRWYEKGRWFRCENVCFAMEQKTLWLSTERMASILYCILCFVGLILPVSACSFCNHPRMRNHDFVTMWTCHIIIYFIWCHQLFENKVLILPTQHFFHGCQLPLIAGILILCLLLMLTHLRSQIIKQNIS